MAKEDKKNSGNSNKKTEQWAEGDESKPQVASVAAAAEAPDAPDAAKKKRSGPKAPRRPLADRLKSAPTHARRAIIIEEQLKLLTKRRAAILKLAEPETLAQVDPALLG